MSDVRLLTKLLQIKSLHISKASMQMPQKTPSQLCSRCSRKNLECLVTNSSRRVKKRTYVKNCYSKSSELMLSSKRDLQAELDNLKQQMLTSNNGTWGSDPPTSVRATPPSRNASDNTDMQTSSATLS